jgi:hypothetical protein
MMLLQVDAVLLHAAIDAAALDTPHPSLQQIVDKYNVLAKAIDQTPPKRPVADPSAYTANRVGG